jgi:phenylalanyl-tRNA synthetase alpha chain
MLEEIQATCEDILTDAQRDLSEATTEAEVHQRKAPYVGRNGALPALFAKLRNLPKDQRGPVGKQINDVRSRVDELVKARIDALALEGLRGDEIDVTLPGRPRAAGHLHLLTRTWEEIAAIFVGMGFNVVQGPEVESDFRNFEALNIPADHPARAMQDTFYLDNGSVLRTHTSPVQVRVMESQPPPVRVVCPGWVYRRDEVDATHSPVFSQVEGLWVDPDVSFADLKGVLASFVHEFFGPKTAFRFRSSYFPFTEPSAELDIRWGDKWLEVLGSGMVHPNVFRKVRSDAYDPDQVQGFAFGMGIERLTMIRYGIQDLRVLFECDPRFLAQF